MRSCFSYDIREKFYDSHDAHLSYVMRFFRLTSRERFPMLDVLEGAQADTTVTLTEDEGPEQTYWIEEQPVRHDEFHLIPEHPLARRLIGKHQGEAVTISDTGFSTRQVTIKEVKSKYVQAFQDSSANFERWFPEAEGLWMMRVRDIPDDAPDVDEARRREFKPLFDMLDQDTTRRRTVEGQYRDNWLPLGLIGKLLGHDIRTMWVGFALNSDVGIRCCVGSVEERTEAARQFEGNSPLVADPLAFITLYHLPCRDALMPMIGKLVTSQSVIDEFRAIVERRRLDKPEGFMKVGKADNGYVAT